MFTKIPHLSLGRRTRAGVLALILALASGASSKAAFIVPSSPVAPGGASVAPPLTSAPAGVLLASLVSPFSFATAAGTTSGTVVTAVYRNASGTLDFYYQINNDAASATALARITTTSYTLFNTQVAYRTDGASVSGLFVNGTSIPVTADRDASGSTVAFNFFPNPPGTLVPPGTSSAVLVISTDAGFFTAGNASIIDGGTQTVAAFQPFGAAPPTISKVFGAPTIGIGGVTTLGFTITNPNAALFLTGVSFTDPLPAGLLVATPNGLTGSCGGGTLTANAGTSTISLSLGAIAAASSCSFAVNVVGVSGGLQTNVTSPVTTSVSAPGSPATATIAVLSVTTVSTPSYQINYLPASGTGIAGGYVDISNDGSLGADAFGPLAGTTGRICVNVYTFTADEQETECCSCLVTPNALVHLTAADLIGNPGNGVTPTLGIVVKLLATIPGPGVNTQGAFTSSTCNAAQTFTTANLAPGLVAWASKFHANATNSPATVSSLTETLFSAEPLSPGELTKLTNLCQFLSGNQSGAGLCKSCTLGGLGAGKR